MVDKFLEAGFTYDGPLPSGHVPKKLLHKNNGGFYGNIDRL